MTKYTNTINAIGRFDIITDLHQDLGDIGLLDYTVLSLSQMEDEGGTDLDNSTWYLEATFTTNREEDSLVFVKALNESYQDVSSMVFTYMSNDKDYKEFVFHNGKES
jgi:hypothetical protein